MATTLRTQTQTLPAILGTFKNGIATPNKRFNIKKKTKVIIVFMEPLGKTDADEEAVFKIAQDGYKEYQKGKTEDYNKWMLKEYPQIYKANRSKTRKNADQN